MMTATVCPSPDELKALTLGQLPEEQSGPLFEHLRNCSVCRSELETVDDLEDSLIACLRQGDDQAEFAGEPDCQLAVAKALGALAATDQLQRTGLPTDWPEAIGEYEIMRPLGSGGMGTVFLARHTKLARHVALKVLATHRLADTRMRERFEAEMRAIGKLSHPNIVTAHDARDVSGTAVLVMEYVDGMDLGQLVQRVGPLPIADACEIVRQVAIALEYTSSQGFVHRDIKPSNIMLSRSGEVKLLDLGLARLQENFEGRNESAASGLTATGQAMGTADFIAPEQVTESRSVDVRADIYALGCTLFKLLTGRPLFAGDEYATVFAKMTAHVSATPPSLADLRTDAPKSLVKLVDSMVAKQSSDRPQQPREIADKLRPHAARHQLPELVARADTLPVEPSKAEQAISPPSAIPKPLLKRPVPLGMAVAGGLLGLFIGVCLGIVITITNPDGTKSILQLALGSKVEVSESNDDTPAQSSGPSIFAPSKLAMPQIEAASGQLAWQAYDAGTFDQLRQSSQRPVMLNFTADWCIDCQANMRLLENNPSVRRLIERSKVVPVLADWTSKSLVIDRLLQQDLGLGSIPALVFYPADSQVEPIVLRDKLNEAQVAQALVQLQSIDVEKNPSALDLASRRPDLTGTVNVGDSLLIQVTELETNGQERRSWLQQLHVAADGSVAIHPFGTLPVEGLSNRQLAESVRERIRNIKRGGDAQVKIINHQRAGSEEPPSLEFAILKNTDAAGITEALQALNTSQGGSRVLSPHGQWVVADPSLRAPVMAEHQGLNYVLVSDSAESTLGWEDFHGHVNSAQTTGANNIRIHVDQELAKKLQTISAANIGNYCAIIVNGRILAAPRINSAFGETFEISGKFAVDEARQLMQSLTSGLVYSPSNLSSSQASTPLVLPPSKPKPSSKDNLKQMGVAFHNFHDVYRKLPGSINRREGSIGSGRREIQPFSWRVAILPFVEHAELFQEYRFDEAWDSPHNLTLLEKMPAIYRSPMAPAEQPVGETNYLGFAGEKAALGTKDGGYGFQTFYDGLSNTLLLVETKHSVPWTKPEDFPFADYADAQQAIPIDDRLEILMADGAHRVISAPIDWDMLGKLITRAGGD